MKTLVVANWKLNPTSLREANFLFASIAKGAKKLSDREVVICPPFVFLKNVKGIKLGAQNCFFEDLGAFTGEVSVKMLKSLKVSYVILGHSERRKYQKESDSLISKKVKAVLKNKLKPILCVDKVSQITRGLNGIPQNEIKNVVLAYEPLFAIGTGKACSPEKAKKMRILIKKAAKKNVPILYGGSVKADNVKLYIKEAGFQGVLVGGASLKPKEFVGIIKNVF